MKPLYLEGGRSSRLVLDGPSLQLFASGTAPRRFPLPQVRRIVLSGKVECEAAALAACLRHGITLTFLNPEGTLAGIALPSGETRERLAEQMLDFTLHPAWRSLYSDWRRSEERRAIIQALGRFAIRGGDLRPEAVSRLLDSRIAPRFPGYDLPALRRYTAAVLRSRLSQNLAPLHLHQALSAWISLGVDLGADLTAILAWRFYGDCLEWHLPPAGCEWK